MSEEHPIDEQNFTPAKGSKNDGKVQCKWCKQILLMKNGERHLQSEVCRYRGRARRVQADGLVPFDHTTTIGKMAVLGEIPGAKIVAYNFEAFVPKWVAQAEEAYKKNDGYAGMSFKEFFDKLRSENADK